MVGSGAFVLVVLLCPDTVDASVRVVGSGPEEGGVALPAPLVLAHPSREASSGHSR